MCEVAVSIPEEVLFDKNMSRGEAQKLAQQMTALGLYTRRDVSLGYCADVACMTKADFVRFLSSFGISVFHYDSAEQFNTELAHA